MTPTSDAFAAEVARLSIQDLHELGDPVVRGLLADFIPMTHASEIAIWAKVPGEDLLAAFIDTAGPEGGFEMKVTQPLSEGIVTQVYREQSSYIDKGLWRNKKHSPLVDQQLHQRTQNEMCVPFQLAGCRLGVMSAVQLTDAKHAAPVRWGFDDQDLALLELAARAVSQAMERAFLAKKLAGGSGEA
jgi:GAF domain